MGHQEDIVKTESKIIVVRNIQVILDRDVAELYGVTTKVVNQAIRNNPDKFPSGYVIELTNSEKEYVVKNFDHLETLKFSHATVKGFTEQGLYMLATILKLATENAQAYLWCEPGNPQILFGNNMILNRGHDRYYGFALKMQTFAQAVCLI